MRAIVRYIAVVLLFLCGGEAMAQQMKERGLVRKGNEQYYDGDYQSGIKSYREALKHDSTSFEAKYDLASALYRDEQYAKADSILTSIVDDSRRSEKERGEVAYNLGNVQFAQKKYKEALSSYRKAMRCNPDDEDAKFNYAFTKRLIQKQEQQQQQQNQDQNQQQNQDQNQQQNQDQNQQQNQDKQQEDNKGNQEKDNQQDKQDKQEDKQDRSQGQDDKQDKKDEEQGGGQPQPKSSISPEQQEALLQAIQAEEDKTQDKLKEKARVIVRGGKNW